MKLLDFHKVFPTEESCKLKFKQIREQEGIICSRCSNTSHYWKKKREQWECKKCTHRTTLKSGTVMHNSKLSFQYWFMAMTFITSTKKSFSAKEIQRQIGHNRYQPIWEMMHKLRAVMGMRDDLYSLKDQVELDEGFFETVDIRRDYSQNLKRGRGSEKQTTVLVSTESIDIETEEPAKNKKKTKLRYIKMKVINSLKKDVMKVEVNKIIDKGSILKTDGSNSYNDLKTDYIHQPTIATSKSELSKLLPWAHTAISNAKKLLLDVHHRIDDDFLQNYLNEFCFKVNRRYFDCIFERLIIAGVSNRWDSFGETSG